MALAQTELPELKRFTFFVSRRFEEGRERFRLHMGHFATLAEAEEWLSVVREIYPGAWAGEAPGRKLRERAAAAAAAQAQYAAGPQPAHSVAPTRASAPAHTNAASAPLSAAPTHVPVLHAAPPLPQAAALKAPAPAARPSPAAHAPKHPKPAQPAQPAPSTKTLAAKPVAQAARPAVVTTAAAATAQPAARRSEPLPAAGAAHGARTESAVAKTAAPIAKQPPAAKVPPVAVQSAPAPASSVAAPAKHASAPAGNPTAMKPAAVPATQQPARAATTAAVAARRGAKPVKPVFEDSNVREVLKALGDQQIGETREMHALPAPLPQPVSENPSLTDTQVLKMLETRRSDQSQPLPVETVEGNIPLLKPDDTGTRRALKDAVTHNAPVAFAVQLQWSVQPPDLESVPPLAIFSAYTLYTVEGSRDGRKWYGLRLGFFTDAISAKQVAHYVRSEFASVAVVPVSPGEKARATDQEIAATLAAPPASRPDPMDEFKLTEEPRAAAPNRAAAPAGPAPKGKVAVGRALREASSPRGSVGARERRGAHTLEETLEILGAGQLSIDNGNGTTLNDSGVRHLRVEVQKNSPFSRLLERLSERLKKS
jgi:hypothetical protein